VHAEELGRHYAFVKLDVSRDAGADAVRRRLQGSAEGGVPWYAILDTESKVLATSNMAEEKTGQESTNIGFPSSTEGIEHFLKMMRETAPRLSSAQLAKLRHALGKSR
jgi:hypothetical protein